MAADGKLLQGQVTSQPDPARSRSAVELLLAGWLRALAAEATTAQPSSILYRAPGTDGKSSAPQRLIDLGGRRK